MRRFLLLVFLAALVAGFHEWTPPAHAATNCFFTQLQPPTGIDNLHVAAGATTTAACSVDYYVVLNLETIDPQSGTFQPWTHCSTPSGCAITRPTGPTGSHFDANTSHNFCGTGNCVYTLQDRIGCGAQWKVLATIFNANTRLPIFSQETSAVVGCV